tara:strand:- start:612 stop:1055 length:444 start_codon:yes stop_codon:yes gene_type:complete
MKIIAKNKRASYDYQLKEKVEAGVILVGTEVKSLRLGKATIAESYITIDKNDEVWAYNINIPQYEFGNINNHDETRRRKLLLHQKEIQNLKHQMQAGGMTIVPTILYFKNSRVKIELALGKGKKLHDKRNDQAKKDIQRKIRRGIYE